MKTMYFKPIILLAALVLSSGLHAQLLEDLQYYRTPGQDGINVFETGKKNDVEFTGPRIRVGGNFTQQYQSLSHENKATSLYNATGTLTTNNNLYALAPGFNLATANLNFDIQLADGIRVSLENYMSSRHHNEFWVKGGYIQIDKLSGLGWNNTGWFDDNLSVKIGHMEVNYGDQHFRRSDNGNTAYNPFIGNYIMDAFTTEIGGEVYYYNPSGFFGMVGLTSGLISGNVLDPNPTDTNTLYHKRNPSLYLKLGYDKQLNDDMRLRVSGSLMNNSNTTRNTLYGGDRTGSRFYMVMENDVATAANQFTSGRINPNFSNQINAMMFNAFFKFQGFEVFGTFEMAGGKTFSNSTNPDSIKDRGVTQFAVEGVYRFLEREQVFVGARFNQVSGQLLNVNTAMSNTNDIPEQSISRIEIAGGWWVTKNMMLKLGYVTQSYNDFNATSSGFDKQGNAITDVYSDIRHEGLFKGVMVEAVIAF